MGTSNFIDEASTSAGPGSDTASKASSRSDLSRSQQTAAYYGAGRLQAGEIVQFLPHPVVSGLLSSAGICLLGAAISITLGETVDRPWAASTLQGADLDFIHHAFSLLAAKPLQLGAAAALALAAVGLFVASSRRGGARGRGYPAATSGSREQAARAGDDAA